MATTRNTRNDYSKGRTLLKAMHPHFIRVCAAENFFIRDWQHSKPEPCQPQFGKGLEWDWQR